MMNPSFIPGPYIGGYHCYTASIVMIVCYYSFYMASFTDPGVIPDKQAAKVAKKRYPFDEVMYKRDNDCKTCGFEKPARSKHCAVCNVCVEKFDHHCIWINNCVGRKNYRYFLTFLGLHCIICLYGAVVGLLIFLGEKDRKDAAGLVFVNTVTGERAAPTLWTHVKFFFLNEERHLGVVVSICAIITPVLCGFFGYHLRLAWNNETTNESYKREAVRAGIQFQLDTLGAMTKKIEDWEPEKKGDQLPQLRVDGEDMPRSKQGRLKRYKEFETTFIKRREKIGPKTLYQPHPSLKQALLSIWDE